MAATRPSFEGTAAQRFCRLTVERRDAERRDPVSQWTQPAARPRKPDDLRGVFEFDTHVRLHNAGRPWICAPEAEGFHGSELCDRIVQTGDRAKTRPHSC